MAPQKRAVRALFGPDARERADLSQGRGFLKKRAVVRGDVSLDQAVAEGFDDRFGLRMDLQFFVDIA